MNVHYLNHSGFYVPLKTCGLLFDYYKASLPEIDPALPLYVFASHSHRDHCDPAALKRLARRPNTTFVLAAEIKGGETWAELPENIRRDALFMEADETRVLGGLTVSTLRSTDCGVAFIVRAEGLDIYHAGDLNDWYWDWANDEDRAWVEDMTRTYNALIDPLRGRHFHLAFVPMDPRLKEPFRGLDELLERVQIDWLFPMHLWGRYSLIGKWLKTPAGQAYKGRVAHMTKKGQIFENDTF